MCMYIHIHTTMQTLYTNENDNSRLVTMRVHFNIEHMMGRNQRPSPIMNEIIAEDLRQLAPEECSVSASGADGRPSSFQSPHTQEPACRGHTLIPQLAWYSK